MKFDPNKTYPYPVLRPGSSDYPRAEFEVEPEIERIRGTTALRLVADFELSDQTLLELIEQGDAEYVLLVRSSATHHRSVHCSSSSSMEEMFGDGRLSGRTEVRGLVVATRCLTDFHADGWHEDYQDRKFDIPAGSVLAEDEPKPYWIDTAEEAAIGSIFELKLDSNLAVGRWACDLRNEKIALQMSPDDYHRFRKARDLVNGKEEAIYIMNAIYLPALVYVLQQADYNNEDYEELRWYRSLNKRLEDTKCHSLGQGTDRLADAQTLLDQPFANMPLMTAESGDGS